MRPGWFGRFAFIWIGQKLSLVGSKAGGFALVWWLTQETGSAQVLATASMALILPTVLLGPIAGAYVDRWNRRRTILLSDTFIAMASLLLAYLFWSGQMQIWHVYLVILLRSVGNALHEPALGASVSMLVPKEHLARVAGAGQATKGVMSVTGPVLGALLISILPVHGVMLIDVGTAAFAVLPLLFLAIPQPAGTPARRAKLRTTVAEGLRFVWSRKGFVYLLAIAALGNFLLNPVFVLLPLFVTEQLGGEALHLGWLQSMWGIGLAAGGVALAAWGGFRKRVVTLYISGALQAAALVLLGLVPGRLFFVAAAAVTAHGFFNAFHNGSLTSLIQAAVPKHMQGRVFTLMESLLQSIYPISLAAVGPVVAVIGIRAWYVGGSLIMVFAQAGALLLPAIRHLEAQAAMRLSQEESPA